MANNTSPQIRPIVTRAEARAAGAKRYFTGKPCIHGHICQRIVLDGHCIECKRCRDRCREINREKDSIQRRAHYRKLDKDDRERILKRKAEQNRQYRAANPEKHRAKARAYQNSFTREERRKRNKAWLAANPFRARMYTQRRRARKLKAEGFYIADDIEHIRKAQRNRCALCKVNLKHGGYVDHIKALSKGGSNWPRNLQLLCLSCNSRKSARDQADFVRELGLLI